MYLHIVMNILCHILDTQNLFSLETYYNLIIYYFEAWYNYTMKHAILTAAIGIFGIVGIIYATVTNAEVKGYTDVHGCTGECYERYTAKYGTFSEQLEAKRVAMQQETPAD